MAAPAPGLARPLRRRPRRHVVVEVDRRLRSEGFRTPWALPQALGMFGCSLAQCSTAAQCCALKTLPPRARADTAASRAACDTAFRDFRLHKVPSATQGPRWVVLAFGEGWALSSAPRPLRNCPAAPNRAEQHCILGGFDSALNPACAVATRYACQPPSRPRANTIAEDRTATNTCDRRETRLGLGFLRVIGSGRQQAASTRGLWNVRWQGWENANHNKSVFWEGAAAAGGSSHTHARSVRSADLRGRRTGHRKHPARHQQCRWAQREQEPNTESGAHQRQRRVSRGPPGGCSPRCQASPRHHCL